jgi:hypothetical protein
VSVLPTSWTIRCFSAQLRWLFTFRLRTLLRSDQFPPEYFHVYSSVFFNTCAATFCVRMCLYTFINSSMLCGSYHHGMGRPQVADGEDGLHIWWVAASILIKQSRTVDKGLSSSLKVGRGATTLRRKKISSLWNVTQASGGFLWTRYWILGFPKKAGNLLTSWVTILGCGTM